MGLYGLCGVGIFCSSVLGREEPFVLVVGGKWVVARRLFWVGFGDYADSYSSTSPGAIYLMSGHLGP